MIDVIHKYIKLSISIIFLINRFLCHFNLLVVVFWNGIILVYDIKTLKIHQFISQVYCTDELYCADISPLSSVPLVYVGLIDGSFRIINAKTGDICEYIIKPKDLGVDAILSDTDEPPGIYFILF